MTRNVFQLLKPQLWSLILNTVSKNRDFEPNSVILDGGYPTKNLHFKPNFVISDRGYPIKNLHFEPNFVASDRGYPTKNLHFEPNFVILKSIMYPIKNLHFWVKFWVQNHHSKHKIDRPHDCKSLRFFYIFLLFFDIFQKNLISTPWFQNFFDATCYRCFDKFRLAS